MGSSVKSEEKMGLNKQRARFRGIFLFDLDYHSENMGMFRKQDTERYSSTGG